MDDFEQTKTCWGVTFYAVAAFTGFVVLATALADDGSRDVAANDLPGAVVANK